LRGFGIPQRSTEGSFRLLDAEAVTAAITGVPSDRLCSLLKNSGFLHDREGHEFHSCRNCCRINSGFQSLRDCCAEKILFQQTV